MSNIKRRRKLIGNESNEKFMQQFAQLFALIICILTHSKLIDKKAINEGGGNSFACGASCFQTDLFIEADWLALSIKENTIAPIHHLWQDHRFQGLFKFMTRWIELVRLSLISQITSPRNSYNLIFARRNSLIVAREGNKTIYANDEWDRSVNEADLLSVLSV